MACENFFHDKSMWRGIIHKCLFTYMAIIHPYTVTIISTSAFDDVIGVIRLSNLIIGVNYDLSERVNTVSKNNKSQGPRARVIRFKRISLVLKWLLLWKCHYYLEYVVSWFNICNVHPLAVNIMSVCIPASHCDPLLTKVCTLVPLFNS